MKPALRPVFPVDTRRLKVFAAPMLATVQARGVTLSLLRTTFDAVITSAGSQP